VKIGLVLGKDERVVAAARFVAGQACLLSFFETTKKVVVGRLDAFDGLLQDMSRDLDQIGTHLFTVRKFGTLVSKVQGDTPPYDTRRGAPGWPALLVSQHRASQWVSVVCCFLVG